MGYIILPVTLTTAAGLAFINLWLQMRIGRVRGIEKVSIGDGGSELLIRRMRAQANFVENAPFVLVLIAAIELAKGTSTLLWIVGAVFLIARVVHPFGMDGTKYARSVSTGITMLLLLGLGVYAAWVAWHGMPQLTPVEVTTRV
ncbi:hypothetical protein BH09PSE4_BH09PSE4_10080 [soil metagenome]